MTVLAGDLYAGARARIGLNFADGRLDDTNIVGANTAISTGLMELCAAHDWDWLYAEGTVSVVSGTTAYPLPTRHMRTLWLCDDNNEELQLRQRRDAIRYAEGTGRPRFFSILNNAMYLSPTPSEAATYRTGYYAYLPFQPAATIADLDNQALTIPDIYVPLASLYVAKSIAMMFKDYDAHKMILGEIRDELQRVSDNTRRSLGPVAPQTRSDGW